jgi:tRNA U34 5-methylaminomethyl-2-thiouridine-forming methyltransferase MnmC
MLETELTSDGSYTFFSSEFGESFHSHHGARQEARLKFVEPTQLAQKALQRPILRLLDVCYGLGYNTAAALETIWAVNPSCFVEVIGLESDSTVPRAAISCGLMSCWHGDSVQILTQLAIEHQVEIERFKATLLIGDARRKIERVRELNFQADAIFLDPFSPPKCPHLWTVEFFERVSHCLAPDGILATYSCAAAVRTALMVVGLQIGSTPPVGRRSPGTIASWEATDWPLSSREREYLQTRAAIPYRDPKLCDSNEVILSRRQQEQQASSLEPTSQWRKRHGLG